MINNYEAAQQYMARGWNVIPLNKRTRTPDFPWKEFQTRYASPGELKEWFFETDNLVGVVTGELSNLTVVDTDSEDATALFAERNHVHHLDDLTQTPTVQTRQGFHYYFTFESGSRNFQQRKDLPGIDMRSEGGFVCAPPSIHPKSGKPYVWVNDPKATLLTPPSWIFAKRERVATVIDATGKIPVGERHGHLFSIAGALRFRGVPENIIATTLMAENKTRCAPELPEAEIAKMVKGVMKYAVPEQASQGLTESGERDPLRVFVDPISLKEKIIKLYETGIPRGLSTGIAALDDHYRIPLGQLSVVTGNPGSGKSTLLSHVMVNLITNAGWRFIVFSGENQPYENYQARLIATYIEKPFDPRKSDRMSMEERDHGLDFFQAYCKFVDQKDEGLTVAEMLRSCEALMEVWPFQGVIFDPWSEFDRHDIKETLTEVYGQELKAICSFVHRHPVHAWVVAHPRQQYRNKDGDYNVPTASDISGSANFRNRADFCLTIHRTVEESATTEVHIQKVRFGENGMTGMVKLGFNPTIQRYYSVE